MKKISINISDEDSVAIKNFYRKSDKQIIDVVVSDILNRYLNVEYFDPELDLED